MAKFQKGDKVRITAFKHGEERHCKGGFNVGDIITITIVYARTLLPNYYEVAETDDYFFFEDELEPVKDDTCSHNCDTCTCHHDTVTINTDIPLNDKKEAHRVVHAIVEKVYKDAATAKAKPQTPPGRSTKSNSPVTSSRIGPMMSSMTEATCTGISSRKAVWKSLSISLLKQTAIFMGMPHRTIRMNTMSGSANASPLPKHSANPSRISSRTKNMED